MKSEVYSWRVSKEMKMALEAEARNAGITFAALLDRMANEWLITRRSLNEVGDEQARLQAAAAEFIGSISGGQRNRAANAREIVKSRIRAAHGR